MIYIIGGEKCIELSYVTGSTPVCVTRAVLRANVQLGQLNLRCAVWVIVKPYDCG